ncbi:hypothetical protein AB1Y20_018595 [Prymnesium parvum]|uniref:Uncharacterized protein n=1 Tax=Prymnesium parvum TaxID=97485 RepID=A0AB34JQC0_PRYPA
MERSEDEDSGSDLESFIASDDSDEESESNESWKSSGSSEESYEDKQNDEGSGDEDLYSESVQATEESEIEVRDSACAELGGMLDPCANAGKGKNRDHKVSPEGNNGISEHADQGENEDEIGVSRTSSTCYTPSYRRLVKKSAANTNALGSALDELNLLGDC